MKWYVCYCNGRQMAIRQLATPPQDNPETLRKFDMPYFTQAHYTFATLKWEYCADILQAVLS